MSESRFWTGFWRLADPKISLTSVAAVYLGASVAAADAPFSWLWVIVLLLALFAIEVAKNAWGDIFDYDSGTDLAVAPEDRTTFSGGKRVMVDGLLTRNQTWAMAAGFTLAGFVLGAMIVFFREPAALWIGVIGMILGWSYHGPPLHLIYRGFGELDVVICYGPLITLAAYLVQTHELSWQVFWLSIPLGLVIAAFLWVNQFPDYRADRDHGKRNLVVRLGKHKASRILPLIYLAAFAILTAAPLTGLPATVWLGWLAAIPAAYASVEVWRDPETFYRSKPVQPAALITFLAYSAGAGTGVLIG
ncbi:MULTISPECIES: prenyltransferase [unclassified Wenzhouxiangella]|uniref:prenyltransferase n=1 Tax=unclassified Wenzhouxiangella TaxID=2613841 RepID=UPI0015F264A1|nr:MULTISPECIES: prenyltransferase [unclassified Wenzhouxiangella]